MQIMDTKSNLETNRTNQIIYIMVTVLFYHIIHNPAVQNLILISSVSDPYHIDLDPDPRIRIRDDGSGSEVTFDSVNRIFPIKCYARL